MDLVSETLKALFRDLYENLDSKQMFDLAFTMNGKPFTTKFQAYSETILESPNPEKDISYLFILNMIPIYGAKTNACIFIRNTELYDEGISSMIQGNSPEVGCFTPVLTTNKSDLNRSTHFTTTDVLQVLKTKLILLLPYQKPITLADQATIKNVVISAFRILHRQPALYEKYGYKSEDLNSLRKKLETITIHDLQYITLLATKTPVKIALETILKRPIRDDEMLLDVYGEISFEQESIFNTEAYQSKGETPRFFDSRFMLSICILNALDFRYPDWNIFTLDSTSPEWSHWNSRLKFTNVKLIHPEYSLLNINTNLFLGGRKRKTRRRRSKRLTRRRSARLA